MTISRERIEKLCLGRKANMNLTTVSNDELLKSLRNLVEQERAILTDILQHLLEVENRRLHLKEGYPSLYQYAVEALHYSEAQAFRRISAMRLLKEIPELKTSIEDGTIQLTHLTQAQQYFKHKAKESESLTKDVKVELLDSLKNKTTRETEKVFAKLNPEQVAPDKTRAITETQTEIRFIASNTLLEKLRRFKELDSHSVGDANYNDLFERLVDLALQQKEKNFLIKNKKPSFIKLSVTASSAAKCTVAKRTVAKNDPKTPIAKTAAPKVKGVIATQTNSSHQSVNIRSRHISSHIKRAVLKRDEGKCTFINPITRKRCDSKYFLQFEHKIPFAKGGAPTAENITLLCRNHNLFQAEKVFGKTKIAFNRL
jgi:hypothetical protein